MEPYKRGCSIGQSVTLVCVCRRVLSLFPSWENTGRVAVCRLGRGRTLSRSRPWVSVRGPSRLQNGERKQSSVSATQPTVSQYMAAPDLKYNPNSSQNGLPHVPHTTGRHSSDSTLGSLAMHSLEHLSYVPERRLLIYTVSVHPRNRCESRPDVPHINNGETDGRRQQCSL